MAEKPKAANDAPPPFNAKDFLWGVLIQIAVIAVVGALVVLVVLLMP